MKKLFMAPAPEDWMKIYRKLQLRADNVSSQNPCYIFNPSALPSPEVFDDFSYHSEFEKAMHWRFTVLWARQHNLLAVIEDAQFTPLYFTDDYYQYVDTQEHRIKAINSLIQNLYPYSDTFEGNCFAPGLNSGYPDIIGYKEDIEPCYYAAIVGIEKTDEKGINPKLDDLTRLAEFCSETMLIPMLLEDRYIDGGCFGPSFSYISSAYGDEYIPLPDEKEYKMYFINSVANAIKYNPDMLLHCVSNDDEAYCPWEMNDEYGIPFLTMVDKLKAVVSSSVSKIEIKICEKSKVFSTIANIRCEEYYDHKTAEFTLKHGEPYIVWQTKSKKEKHQHIIFAKLNDSGNVEQPIIAELENEKW